MSVVEFRKKEPEKDALENMVLEAASTTIASMNLLGFYPVPSRKQDIKDIGFLMECIKSLALKNLGRVHPIQKIAEKMMFVAAANTA